MHNYHLLTVSLVLTAFAACTPDSPANNAQTESALNPSEAQRTVPAAPDALQAAAAAFAQYSEAGILHDIDTIALALLGTHFPDQPKPTDRLDRNGLLLDHLSDRHVARGDFITEIQRQIPLLAAFVVEHDLLAQDPTRPLVVRDTPEYMRGSGAGASISAPGFFNPPADTYYNVAPLDDYTEEQAASYLRESNHWLLQILNIHEAIPGHHTQLVHGNKSDGLKKSLLRNVAIIDLMQTTN